LAERDHVVAFQQEEHAERYEDRGAHQPVGAAAYTLTISIMDIGRHCGPPTVGCAVRL
jgi:hypothetical protein